MTAPEECGWCDGTGVVCQHCGNGPETCECEDFAEVTCKECNGQAVLLP